MGHDQTLAALKGLWDGGAGPRTLLFAGPESVGRRKAARWLAAFVNCRAKDGRPCGACESCRLLRAGAHPDYREVGPRTTTGTGRAKRSLELRIDQLVPREGGDPEPLGPWLLTRPRFEARVGVIDHAESLNVAAANAFLKLLEEPPKWALIVLVAPGPDALLPTVASRATTVRFRPVDEAELELVAPGAHGHPGWRLGQPGVLLRGSEAGAAEAREAAEALLEALGDDLGTAVAAGEAFAKAVGEALETGVEPGPLGWLREALRREAPGRYAAALDAIDRCERALGSYAQATLACAVLVLELRQVLDVGSSSSGSSVGAA